MENDQLVKSPVLERGQGVTLLVACFVGFILSQFVAGVVAGVATNTIAHQGLTHFLDHHFEWPWWLTASQMFGLWLGFAAIVVLAMKTVQPVLPTGFFKVRWQDLKFLPLGVLLQALVGALYYPFHVESASDPVKQVVGHNPAYGMLVIMFFVGIGAPFIEELLFRGVILQAFIALGEFINGWQVRALAYVISSCVLFNQIVGDHPSIWRIVIDVPISLYIPFAIWFLFRLAIVSAYLRIVSLRIRLLVTSLVPALLTGVVFGAAHGEPVQLAGLALVGTILAVIVQRQRRIAPAIFTHAGFNLIALSVAWASVAIK